MPGRESNSLSVAVLIEIFLFSVFVSVILTSLFMQASLILSSQLHSVSMYLIIVSLLSSFFISFLLYTILSIISIQKI